MQRYLVLGAGMIGPAIAKDLSKHGRVTLADIEATKAREAEQLGVEWQQVDVTDSASLVKLMDCYDVVISALRYDLHYLGAQAAIEAGCNFCDLGTDPDILKQEFDLDEQAKEAGITIIPDCGVSPGLTNILAGLGVSKLDSTEYIRLRVGGIPLEPQPPFNYMVVASIPVIVNEYVAQAEIIEEGKVCRVDSLSGLEEISFPGFGNLEAFYAACGTSTLTRSFRGIKDLDDKTIRYSGHCQLIRDFLKDHTRRELEEYLLAELPKQGKDVLLLRVTVGGQKDGVRSEIVYSMVDRYDDQTNMTAMARTTASPVSIIAQMLANGRITQRGVLEQELYVPHQEFLDELTTRRIIIKENISRL